jgi:hypothetical protein
VKEVTISICTLLAVLEIKEGELFVPKINHHFVNANSPVYGKLEEYVHLCINTQSNETLDLNMEGVFFTKFEGFINGYSVNFIPANQMKSNLVINKAPDFST